MVIRTNFLPIPQKAIDSVLEGLTFNELSGTFTVSKGWRDVAERVRTARAYAGLNAGFLYRLTDPASLNSGYLYMSHPNSFTQEVLSTNPLLRAAFNKAQTVVCDRFGNLAPEQEQEVLESLKEIPLTIEQRVPSERLTQINQRLWGILEKKLSAEKWRAVQEKIGEKKVGLASQIGIAVALLWGEKKMLDPQKRLLEQAQMAKKPIVNFSPSYFELLRKFVLDWIQTDEGLEEFLNLFEQQDEAISQFVTQTDQAWIQGHRKFYDQAPVPFPHAGMETEMNADLAIGQQLIDILRECHQKLQVLQTRAYEILAKEAPLQAPAELKGEIKSVQTEGDGVAFSLEKWNQRMEENIAKLDRIKKRFEPLFLTIKKHEDRVASQIITALEQSPLVLLDPDKLLIEKLKNRGMEVVGPLRAPLKPRGFFWKLTDSEGRTGHLVGSIHVTPASLLDFNRSFLSAFEQAGVVAVEIDGTRKEILEVLLEQKQQYFQDEIQSLSEDERERLFDLFQKLLPLATLQETESIPKERDLFLVWVAHRLLPSLFQSIDLGPGIDFKFIEMAKSKNIPVEDLENVEMQLKAPRKGMIDREFFSSLAQLQVSEAQEIFSNLRDILKARVIDGYVNIWEFGLTTELEKEVNQKASADQEIMIERNRIMADSIIRLISSGRKPFCIAGCAHGVGQGSILEFLKEAGVTSEQIFYEEPNIPALLKMATKI